MRPALPFGNAPIRRVRWYVAAQFKPLVSEWSESVRVDVLPPTCFPRRPSICLPVSVNRSRGLEIARLATAKATAPGGLQRGSYWASSS